MNKIKRPQENILESRECGADRSQKREVRNWLYRSAPQVVCCMRLFNIIYFITERRLIKQAMSHCRIRFKWSVRMELHHRCFLQPAALATRLTDGYEPDLISGSNNIIAAAPVLLGISGTPRDYCEFAGRISKPLPLATLGFFALPYIPTPCSYRLPHADGIYWRAQTPNTCTL